MKKKLAYITLFILIVINGLYLYQKSNKNDYIYNNTSNIMLTSSKGLTLKKGDVLEQKIKAVEDNLYQIKIYMNLEIPKRDEYTTVNLLMRLLDSNRNLITEYKFEKVFFKGEYAINFKIPNQINSKDQEYIIQIESYKTEDFSLLAGTDSSNLKHLMINNEETSDSLFIKTVYLTNENDKTYYMLFFIITSVFIGMIYFLRKIKKLENKYLFMAIILSLLFLILSPLFIGQDELSHWARIYEISNGNIVSDQIDDWPGTIVPNNITDIDFYYYSDLKENINIPYTDDVVVNMEYTSVYSMVSYLPQIIGFKIGKLLTKKAFFWPYFARLFQAIFSIVLVYNAIKLMPFGKKVIFVIGLLPSFLIASSLLSTDAILTSSTILFVAKILNIIYTKKDIDKKDYILLLILSFIIAISKLVYIPICLLIFLIPIKRKESFKNYIIIFAATILLTLIWNMFALKNLTNGQGVNTLFLLKYYLLNPIEYLKITSYTFMNSIGNFMNDVFGGNNNWFGTTIDDASIYPQFFMMIYLFSIFNCENKLDKTSKIILVTVIFLTYMLISTSLLLSCTPVLNIDIIGIQGRYFISLLILFYLVFSNKIKAKDYDYTYIITLVYCSYFLQYFLQFI